MENTLLFTKNNCLKRNNIHPFVFHNHIVIGSPLVVSIIASVVNKQVSGRKMPNGRSQFQLLMQIELFCYAVKYNFILQ